MAAGKYNIVIDKKTSFNKTQGHYSGTPSKLNPTEADLEKDITDGVLVPVNLTGCTLVAKMKKRIQDTAVVITFTTNIVDAVNGIWSFSLTNTQTANLAVDSGVYDVLLTYPSGFVDKIMEGNVRVEGTAS